jgi:dTMP kinase
VSVYLGIEGVDGSGKSTVAAAVTAALRSSNREALLVREPGGTRLGEEIRTLLLHGDDMTPWAEALLFAAQRAQLVAEVVGPALAAGTVVVSDRTYYSSLAYQGGARRLGLDQVRAVNEAGLGGIVPDLVAVLWFDPDDALSREDGPDRISGEGGHFQRRVAEAYQALADADARVRLIDASRTVDENVAEIVGWLR